MRRCWRRWQHMALAWGGLPAQARRHQLQRGWKPLVATPLALALMLVRVLLLMLMATLMRMLQLLRTSGSRSPPTSMQPRQLQLQRKTAVAQRQPQQQQLLQQAQTTAQSRAMARVSEVRVQMQVQVPMQAQEVWLHGCRLRSAAEAVLGELGLVSWQPQPLEPQQRPQCRLRARKHSPCQRLPPLSQTRLSLHSRRPGRC